MGSYNIDCALSNLPIEESTKVRAFILAETKGHLGRNSFYSSSAYTPISVGAVGEYNDYGKISSVKSSNLFEIAVKHYFPSYNGTPEQLINDIRSGTVSSTKGDIFNKGQFNLEIAFVREDVYQSLTKFKYNFENNDPTLKNDFYITDEDLRKDLTLLQEQVNEWFDVSEDYGVAQEAMLDVMLQQGLQGKLSTLSMLFAKQEGDLFSKFIQPYKTNLINKLKQTATLTQEIVDDARELGEYLHLNNHVLPGLSKLWLPSTQMVGGSTPFLLHQAFADAVSQISEKELETRAKFESDPDWYKSYKVRKSGQKSSASRVKIPKK